MILMKDLVFFSRLTNSTSHRSLNKVSIYFTVIELIADLNIVYSEQMLSRLEGLKIS